MINYQKAQKLGEGTYDVCFRGVHKKTGEHVCLKYININMEIDGIPSTSFRELTTLIGVSHPNIVTLRDVLYEKEKIVLVLEEMEMSLGDFVMKMKKAGKQIPKAIIKSYTFQLISGVFALHKIGITHRGLKMNKILIDKKGSLKITGFNRSSNNFHTIDGSFESPSCNWYVAPEQLLESEYQHSPCVDIWSCGCIIADLVSHCLFMGDTLIDQLVKIFEVLGKPTEDDIERMPWFKNNKAIEIDVENRHTIDSRLDGLDPDLIDLIKKMVVIDPCKRITAFEAINHPYFKDVSPAVRNSSLSDPAFTK